MGSGRRPRRARPPAAAARTSADRVAAVPSTSDGGCPTTLATSDGRRLFVAKLPLNVSRTIVWNTFKQFGEMKEVHLVRNKADGQFRGFGFVTFRDQAGAQNALSAAESRTLLLHDRPLHVEPAQARRPKWGDFAPIPVQRRSPPARFVPTGPCHVDRLPAELLQLIISLLPLRQQVSVQWVCHRWQGAVRGVLRRRREVDLRRDFLVPSDRGKLDGAVLESLLRLTTGLQTLHTGEANLCPWDTVDYVVTYCSNLVSIDMASATFTLDDHKLMKLVTSCPRLEEVKLPSLYLYNEVTVRMLLDRLPRLRSLELSGVGRTTGQCFSLLPVSLRRLHVPFCRGLLSSSVRHVARCPELRELDVSGVAGLQAEDLAAALAGCPRLQRLLAARLQAPPELYLPPAGAVALTHLDLEEARGVTDATLRRLPELAPGLVSLNMQGCDSVTEAGLRQLCRCVHLQTLDISYLRCISDRVLDLLHGLPLMQLRLAQGAKGRARFTTDGIIRLVVSCPSLALLDLSCAEQLSVDVVDELLRQLPNTRDVAIYVGGTRLEKWPSPPAGPLRMLQYITVPLCRRKMTMALLWNEGDEDEEVPTIVNWRSPPRP